MNLRLASLTKEAWWNNYTDMARILDCVLYVTVYLLTSLLFALGLAAPGIKSARALCISLKECVWPIFAISQYEKNVRYLL